MNPFYDQFNTLIQNKIPFVMVTLVDTIGSVPQEPGAKMLVTNEGLSFGTVGGGKVEARAIQEAQAMLSVEMGHQKQQTLFTQWHLNSDIGMTCGGSVRFYFEVFNRHTWHVAVFGAGHVGQALVTLLLNLDCHVTCIDSRIEWLSRLPDHPRLAKKLTDDMPSQVKMLEENSFVVLMTMGHTTDKPILLELLKTRDFPYIGAIGSKAKAVQFKKDIDEAGLPSSCQNKFICPIGLDIGTNHPHEIAISVIAQLLQVRDHFYREKNHG